MSSRLSVRFKTWPVAAAGFGSLLLLFVLSILQSSRIAAELRSQAEQSNVDHHGLDGKLRRLRSAIHLSSIYVRDYLLDVASLHEAEYRQKLAEYASQSRSTLAELRAVTPEKEQIRLLEGRLDDYWRSFDPLFLWTPQEKVRESAAFLRREVVPRREALLAIAYDIEKLNEDALTAERADTARRYAAFRANQSRVLWQSSAFGLLVAAVAVYRFRQLEHRADDQRRAAIDAEQRMRELSQEVVAAHEDERKRLSRELHDQIAQVLTALRMELGRLDRTRAPSDAAIGTRVTECLALVDNMFQSIRDLALGLRPSVLDDFGLRPALEWLASDFIRRFALSVRLEVEGELDDVPDRHRTCVYRVVQEALTNCARHAQAQSVSVAVHRRGDVIELSVADDGRGLDPDRRYSGLGLRGMEERVRELHGTMVVQTAIGARTGTSLSILLPVPVIVEVPRASAAS